MGGGDVAADSGDSSNAVGEEVALNIRCSNGSKFVVEVKLSSTIENFKSILAQKCEIPPQQQRLIYKGRILKDDQTLQSYGLEADHTVHLVRGFATSGPTENAATSNAGVTTSNPTSTTDTGSTGGRPLGGSGFGSTLFPGLGLGGLGNNTNSSGASLPGMEQMQQQLTQNPNMIRDILNMPLVQNLMNNPETIRNLILNNPQMREVMDRNPELAHILNDPTTLRQTMEAVRNPEIMREMMRNTDRAMSNIESSPEGFNMLRRMYENVQEPFLNATSMTGDNRSDPATNPFAALLGTQGQQPRRENSAGSGTTGSETTNNTPAPNTNPLPNPWASAGTGVAGTNSDAHPNPTGNARPISPGSTGGFGFPDFEQMLGGAPDMNSLNQLMQNPAISQMMRNLLSNPNYVNQVLGLNPQLQSMLDANPQLRDMMQNPEFMRQLTSPEMMQQLLGFSQALSSQFPRQTTRETGRIAGGTADMGLDSLMNMFGALGTGGAGIPTPNRSQAPPEELYATQLSQLQEMGFYDTQENLRALIATAGNIHAAVERLLGNIG
ncbi:ubiquitin domain-containing protein DSK2a-like [Andrographis paniculata]|uniref:ubiquitin domain-containing protein DSK2a-like n=1 Tax=Andrographis paniculata TaxID=175694 RepID=UPI0021E7D6C8|nr:ubiquitin domain-containing protein DSK2a-like [Andrographis paniculata]